MSRKLQLLLLMFMVAGPVGGRAGERILFSGRDGRPVEFEFERRPTLLPAELREDRPGGASPGGDSGGIFLLSTPAVTPTAAPTRKQHEMLDRQRNWLFQEPGSRRDRQPGKTDTDEEARFEAGAPKDSVRRFMETGSSLDETREDAAAPGQREMRGPGRNGSQASLANATTPEGLATPTMPDSRKDPLAAGRMTELGGAAELPGRRSFNPAGSTWRKEGVELDRRAKMDSFRQLLNNPFSPAQPGSANPFERGRIGGGESLPGVTVIRGGGIGNGGGLGAPNRSLFGGRDNSLGTGGLGSGGGLPGNDPGMRNAPAPLKLEPKPIILEIPRRNF